MSLERMRLDNEPWTEGIFSTIKDQITKSMTESKLTKGQDIIKTLVFKLKENPNKLLDFKRLEMDSFFSYDYDICSNLSLRKDSHL